MQEKWRVIETIETNGSRQMAIDEAILSKAEVPTLRFYTWNPPCVSLGIFQDVSKEVNVLNLAGVDLVRRYTGGGVVYHDKEITYSVCVPENVVGKDIVASYKKICNALIKGLGKIGVKAEFKPINDILVDGRKISGNAQTRKNGWVLQHGTILLEADFEKISSLLNIPKEKLRNMENPLIGLRDLGVNLGVGEIRDKFLEGFQEEFGFEYYEDGLNNQELVDKLLKKYEVEDEKRNL